jgi:D-glycero-D-manno-heptose 1,7-bisphosphate phosphatase
MQRAVFLDKDGTLIENVPYNVDPRLVALARGAGPALRDVKSLGFRLVVVSNQPGVALERFGEPDLAAVEQRIQELLAPSGVAIDAFYYCPHLPTASVARYAVRCLCRKPQPGLLRRAASELSLDLDSSWLVGDILDDVEAGNRAGCRSILVCNGNETEWREGPARRPAHRAHSLRGALRYIAAAAGGQPDDPKRGSDAIDLATRP